MTMMMMTVVTRFVRKNGQTNEVDGQPDVFANTVGWRGHKNIVITIYCE